MGKSSRFVISAIAAIVIFAGNATVSAGERGTFEGRHCLELNGGIWIPSRDGINSEIHGTVYGNDLGIAATVAVGYTYWPKEQLAFKARLQGMAPKITAEDGNAESATVTMISFGAGLKFYYLRSTRRKMIQPYLEGTLAAYLGHQREVKTGERVTTQSRNDWTAGARIAAGVNVLVNRRYMVGIEFASLLLNSFDMPLGNADDFTGMEIGLSVGYLIGTGR